MITILLEDNGDYIKKKRTLQSLEKQQKGDFLIKVYPKSCRESFIRKISEEGEGYCLFLCSGSELILETDKIDAWLKKYKADWYYGDEKIRGMGETQKDSPKPDFGIFGFVSYLFTGQGLIFSRRLLKEIVRIDPEDDFPAFMLKLSVEAAVYSDGVHIAEPLILRAADAGSYHMDQRDLERRLNRLLRSRNLAFTAVTDTEWKTTYLYGKRGKNYSTTLIVVFHNAEEEAYWRAVYEPTLGVQQVVLQLYDKNWGYTWNEGARRADGEVLFFVKAGWQFPEEFKSAELKEYAGISHVGAISPGLYSCSGEKIYTGAARVGRGFCAAVSYEDGTGHDYREGVREISVPAWQFFVVRRTLWEQAGGFAEEEISADFCAADFSMRLEKLGYTGLYCGQIHVFALEKTEEHRQKGFLHMLDHWGEDWGKDPYCTRSMCRNMLEECGGNTVLYVPENYKFNSENGKKLLVLSHELSMTGAPIVLMYAVRILKENGFDVVLLSPKDGVLKKNILEEHIPVLIDEEIYNSGRWLTYAEEFDLILVNTVVPFFCIDHLKKSSLPVIWWIHDAREGYDIYLRHVLPESLGKNIDTYCVSGYAKEAVVKYRAGYAPGILPYGLPDLAHNYLEIPQWEHSENRLVFLIVGTLEPRKGQDILLESLKYLRKTDRDRSIFYFIGAEKSAEITKELKTAIKRDPDMIRWIPFLSRDEIFKAYAGAAAVICCSRDDPLPTVMAETMMMSGICICSENTGTAELLETGKNGFLYHDNSPEELAECITYVINHCAELASVRRKARETYEKVFSMQAFKNRLLKIVDQNLKKRQKNGNDCEKRISSIDSSI